MKTLKTLSATLAVAILVLSACEKDSNNNPKPIPKPTPDPINYITDVCDNTYPVVKIGNQYWMAENMACTKFDTESEAYKSGFYELTTTTFDPFYSTCDPFYTDGRNKVSWYDDGIYATKLTGEQINHLGLLYDWAAAMGYKSGREASSIKGSRTRQGICPNGWHIPSSKDWDIMAKTLGGVGHTGAALAIVSYNGVGKHLKTIEGWSGKSSISEGNDNSSGFSALPAGYAQQTHVYDVGTTSHFWTSDSSDTLDGFFAKKIRLSNFDNNIDCMGEEKYQANSVRCIKY